MSDPFLLEAMREVDALTPACPPIAPPPDRTVDWTSAEDRARVEAAIAQYERLVERIHVARRARIRG